MTTKAKFRITSLATLAAALCPMVAGAAAVTLDFNIVDVGQQVEILGSYAAQHVVFGSNSFAQGGVSVNRSGVLIRRNQCINDPNCDDPASPPAPKVQLQTTAGFFFDQSLDFQYWATDIVGGIFIAVYDDHGSDDANNWTLLNNAGEGAYGSTDPNVGGGWADAAALNFKGHGNRIVISGDANKFALDNLALDIVSDAPPPVPEPASYALVMLALVASTAVTRRRKG